MKRGILLAIVVVISGALLPGCVVVRAAGKIVGTGVKTVGKVIDFVIPGG